MNRAKTIIPFLLIMFSFNVYSQDIIYLKDETKIEGKVITIEPKRVIYKKAENPDGPNYIIEKSKVAMIAYENGTQETITAEKTSTPDPRSADFGRHMISWQFSDMLSTNITVDYEYFFKSGKLGLRFPISIGVNGGNYNQPRSLSMPEVFGSVMRIVAGGADMNYYPFGQSKRAFYIGPSLNVGYNNYKLEVYENGYYAPLSTISGNTTRITLYMNGGFLMQPTKNFNVRAQMGLGMSSYRYDRDLSSYEYVERATITPIIMEEQFPQLH